MRRFTTLLVAAGVAIGSAGMAGCGEDDVEDAARDAGNTAEDAAKDAGNTAEDAAKDAGDAAEDVGNDIEEEVGK